jgi:hypothetical protein
LVQRGREVRRRRHHQIPAGNSQRSSVAEPHRCLCTSATLQTEAQPCLPFVERAVSPANFASRREEIESSARAGSDVGSAGPCINPPYTGAAALDDCG